MKKPAVSILGKIIGVILLLSTGSAKANPTKGLLLNETETTKVPYGSSCGIITNIAKGEEITILDTKGAWTKIMLQDNAVAWVKTYNVDPVETCNVEKTPHNTTTTEPQIHYLKIRSTEEIPVPRNYTPPRIVGNVVIPATPTSFTNIQTGTQIEIQTEVQNNPQ